LIANKLERPPISREKDGLCRESVSRKCIQKVYPGTEEFGWELKEAGRSLWPAEGCVVPSVQHKSVPQRLKPSPDHGISARLKPCPSYRDAFSLSFLAVAPEAEVCTECALAGAKERVCENSISNPVPQGRLAISRDAILDNLQPSLRDLIMFLEVPRTSVLG
jgi:hypothetical protein